MGIGVSSSDPMLPDARENADGTTSSAPLLAELGELFAFFAETMKEGKWLSG
jgi:hypothetical protein